jgi:hypothetical protein
MESDKMSKSFKQSFKNATSQKQFEETLPPIDRDINTVGEAGVATTNDENRGFVTNSKRNSDEDRGFVTDSKRNSDEDRGFVTNSKRNSDQVTPKPVESIRYYHQNNLSCSSVIKTRPRVFGLAMIFILILS